MSSLPSKPDMLSLIEELREIKKKAYEGGGPERIARQHAAGKLTARERLEILLDPGSFVEMYPLVVHRATHFGIDKIKYYGDGVVVGFGKVDGRLVAVFSQDFTVFGGSLSEMHGFKIAKLYDMAMKYGVPIIGIKDSGGARIQEGVVSLEAYGEVFKRNVWASGVIPQIALILGPCAGGAVYSPALMDFVIISSYAYMFITGPEVVKAATGEELTFEQLGGAHIHMSYSGQVHFIGRTDEEALMIARKLLSYLPSNNMADPPYVDTRDPVDRKVKEVEAVVPTDPMKPFDVRDVIIPILDNNEFLEVQAGFAPNVVIGFGRIGGHVVGIVANQPLHMAGALDIDASDKAARWIRFLDAFNIPIVTFVDIPGYLPGKDQEYRGIIRHGSKMLYAYAEATVPKITIILRKAYGGAYLGMCASSMGADFVFAWPSAEIAVMGPEGAVRVLYRKQLAEAKDPDKLYMELIAEYRRIFANPYVAAQYGYITDVIEPADTRLYIARALEVLRSKREERPPKKHGVPPF